MLSYSYKCRKNTENENPELQKQKREKWLFHQTV